MTYTRVSDFISPNAMSLIGVAVAALSARFLAREELKYRQLGVLVFAVRDYIDALATPLGRWANKMRKSGGKISFLQVPNPDSLGYVVDGLCDGIGDTFRFVAMVFLLQRYLSNGAR